VLIIWYSPVNYKHQTQVICYRWSCNRDAESCWLARQYTRKTKAVPKDLQKGL